MIDIRFEWDEAKNLANRRKYGVGFEEAARVFFDPLHLVIPDRIEDGEQRWQALGQIELEAARVVLLLVAHTERETDEGGRSCEVIRIISARRATSHERRIYENEIG